MTRETSPPTPIVVHVAESFGAGVKTAILDYVAAAPGYRHHLVFSPRADSPTSDVDFAPFEQVTELPEGHRSRILVLRRVLRTTPSAVIHAHSSFGGAYARLAVRSTRQRPIVYTPHCYGFERRDLSAAARAVYRCIEAVLAQNTAAFAACSVREEKLSAWPLSRALRRYVPNVAPAGLPTPKPIEAIQARALRLVTAGRLGPHKDPQFFADAVKAIRAAGYDVDPLWIGGGEGEYADLLRAADIPMSGWVPRAEALRLLGDADLYFHTARWEGMPMAVLEAHAIGVPIVVRNIPAFRDSGLPLLVDDVDELALQWPLLTTPERRVEMVRIADSALAANTARRQSDALHELYEHLLSSMTPERRQ